MNARSPQRFALTVAAGVLFCACLPAIAADVDIDPRELTTPSSSAQLGVGYLWNEGRRFGQYSGVNDKGGYGLLDLSLSRRDDATGTWFGLTGRGLGLESRELRLEHNRQGDWGYFVDFSQTPRFEPYTANTRLLGIETGTQTINALPSAQSFDLKTKRDGVTVGFDKILPGNIDLQVRFRNEEKKGSRLFGQGFFGTLNFLTEPIDYTSRQLDVTLNYTVERLQLSGGYYATDFSNDIPALNVVGGIAGLSPMALPPGNQSHQLYFTGGYSFTPTTRGTFKAAYTHQTQTEAFVAPSISGRTDLGGKIDTTLLQGAVTSQPLPKLSLLASLRYEDRDDQTPIAQYFTTGVTPVATLDGTNGPNSIRALSGKAEASYALPAGFRFTGGVDYEARKRNTSRVRTVGFRNETEEWVLRAELRRSLSDTVTGGLSYAYSDRGGSDFLTTVLNNNTPGSNLIHPLNLADRQRNKVRLTLNWQPAEPLSVQLYADYAKDSYSGRLLGPRDGEAQVYSIDASYAVSDKWQASAWISRNVVKADQSTCVGPNFGAPITGNCPATASNPLWDSSLTNLGDAIGVGLRGDPYDWLAVGADVLHSRDKSEYRLSAVTAGAVVSSLPDTYFNVTRLNLFAKYALQKNSGFRLSYLYERSSTDDWTWTNWTYSDGSRVLHEPTQKVHFIGVTMYYRWQ